MDRKSFFAGLEEVFARICSLILSVVFFLIFIVTRGSLEVEWRTLSVILLIFWVIYEVLSLVFFNAFKYFSTSQQAIKQQRATQESTGSGDTNVTVKDLKS